MVRGLSLLVLAALTAGCAKQALESAPQVRGEGGGTDAYLAYEHHVDVIVDADHQVAERIEAVRSACVERTYGTCSVLQVVEGRGHHSHGSVSMRLAPEAVAPVVALAAEAGRLGSRRTTADDLSAAIADTSQQLAQLHTQRAILSELQERSDLAVSDLISLSRELALINTQIEALDTQAGNQRHRLETDRLTLNFRSGDRSSALGRLRGAFGDLGDTFVDGVVDTMEWLAYGLPLLVLAFLLALLWRWLWRRATRQRRRDPADKLASPGDQA